MALTNNKDINYLICHKLDFADLLSLQYVNRKSRDLLRNETFWKQKFYSIFKELNFTQNLSLMRKTDNYPQSFNINLLTHNKLSWKNCMSYWMFQINTLKNNKRLLQNGPYKDLFVRSVAHRIIELSSYLFRLTENLTVVYPTIENKIEIENEIKKLLHNPFIIYEKEYFEMLDANLWEYLIKHSKQLPFKVPTYIFCILVYEKKNPDLKALFEKCELNKDEIKEGIGKFFRKFRQDYGHSTIKKLIDDGYCPAESLIGNESFLQDCCHDKIASIFANSKLTEKEIETFLSNNEYSRSYLLRLVDLYISRSNKLHNIYMFLGKYVDEVEPPHNYADPIDKEIHIIHDYLINHYLWTPHVYAVYDVKIFKWRFNNLFIANLNCSSLCTLSAIIKQLKEIDCYD